MKTIIILIVALVLVCGALGCCIMIMIKTNRKLKNTEAILNSTTIALENARIAFQEGINDSLSSLKDKIESIVNKSKEEFNHSSSSAENTLINGGFKKKEK